MNIIRTTILAAGAVALLGLASPALADAPAQGATAAAASTLQTYAFVDMSRVMHEATAAKSVNEELMGRKNQLKNDFEKKAQSLESEKQALLKQRSTMSPEDFSKKAKPVQEKIDKLEESIRHDRDSFDNVVASSMGKVRALAGDAVEEVAQEKRLAAVFSRDAVILGAKDLDITDEVIKRMNASGKKVAVDWSAKAPSKKQ